MSPAPTFRTIAVTALLLLLALAALAGNGCRRQAAEITLAPVPGSVIPADAAVAVTETLFVFCYPESDRSGLSAAAAQVVSDVQATNDDRTEMMAWQPLSQICTQAAHTIVPLERIAALTPWVRDLLRPPRTLRA
ncbi:hypothetical protein [Xylophilus ampelinus]|uniref:Uncharacterized protein n=1 Tax=Xylophilus ampelinus TaxID=54067 RepID=A0A318SDG0_9BURK|nr:hypothetical protein [Xylophilus ampelinus]MCS4508684.1 hypothetical protein [Xylophilus ampelinus]PYE74301.1 hypothetical protein DFQ15_12620 [Xylophilus ampelinus]